MNLDDESQIVDDNLRLDGSDVVCVHCGTVVGQNGDDADYLALALERRRPARSLGDALIRAEATHFTDEEVVLRQQFCPGCKALLATEVVLARETFQRTRRIARHNH